MDISAFQRQQLDVRYQAMAVRDVVTKLAGQSVLVCVAGLRFVKTLDGNFSLEGDGTVRVRKSELSIRPEPDSFFEYGETKWQVAEVFEMPNSGEWKFTLRRAS